MKFCPECGSIIKEEDNCLVCGCKKEVTSVTENIIDQDRKTIIDNIHTSYLSSSKILEKMNIDNINILEYVKMKIGDNNTSIITNNDKIICEAEKERYIIDSNDYLLEDIENIN